MDAHRIGEIRRAFDDIEGAMAEYLEVRDDPAEVTRLWGKIGFRYWLREYAVTLESVWKHEQDLTPFMKDFAHYLWDSIQWMLSPNEEPYVETGTIDPVQDDLTKTDWAYVYWSWYDSYEDWAWENSGKPYHK
jgi:hypothetical protein